MHVQSANLSFSLNPKSFFFFFLPFSMMVYHRKWIFRDIAAFLRIRIIYSFWGLLNKRMDGEREKWKIGWREHTYISFDVDDRVYSLPTFSKNLFIPAKRIFNFYPSFFFFLYCLYFFFNFFIPIFISFYRLKIDFQEAELNEQKTMNGYVCFCFCFFSA